MGQRKLQNEIENSNTSTKTLFLYICEHFVSFYRPQTKLWKGNVFTSVCQEFCPRGVYPSMHWADPPTGQAAPGKHPPRQTPPGRHPPSRWLLQRTVRILLECILVFCCCCVENKLGM